MKKYNYLMALCLLALSACGGGSSSGSSSSTVPTTSSGQTTSPVVDPVVPAVTMPITPSAPPTPVVPPVIVDPVVTPPVVTPPITVPVVPTTPVVPVTPVVPPVVAPVVPPVIVVPPVVVPVTPVTPVVTWAKLVNEGGTFTLTANQIVRYGSGKTWNELAISAGVLITCNNATFSDPLVGVAKECDLKSGDPIVIPPPPPVVDHSGAGPYVDKTKYAVVKDADKYTTNRINSVYNYPGPGPQWWYPCDPTDPTSFPADKTCTAAPSNLTVNNFPNDIGAFREVMNFAGMSNDDPIVYPGQVGAAHSHTFFGNLVNANTTSANIRSAPWCSAAGGMLNCTSVWIPSMIDTKDGTPVVPSGINFYYKCTYEFELPRACANIVPVPVGLHMVSGNAKNMDPSVGAISTSYICFGPNGENPGWKNTITAAVADGTCLPGGDFLMGVNFPYCWDGVNLDSPNHISHMSGVQQDGFAPYKKYCPATHPIQIPSMSINAHFPITSVGQVARWKLASDMYDNTLPAGLSGHGDYMMGWDPKKHPELFGGENKSITEMWTKHCLNEQRDCHNYLIGNDRQTLY